MIYTLLSRCLSCTGKYYRHQLHSRHMDLFTRTRPICLRLSSSDTSTSVPNLLPLPWSRLPYNSIKLDLSEALSLGWELRHVDDFSQLLEAHVAEWKTQNRSAVWLHIPLSLSVLISLAAEKGFSLHHCKGEEVVMSHWLLEHKENKLPAYASHQVGVCGIVYREDTAEILVTQDKHKPPVWKFPGGLAELAEDIPDAVEREVREETGIDSEFRSILAFRQQHRLQNYFNLSDLYFLCRMNPVTFDLRPCPDEIARCDWKKPEELVDSKDATLLTQRVSKLLLEGKKDGFSTIDLVMEELPMVYAGWTPDKTYKLFLRSRTSGH